MRIDWDSLTFEEATATSDEMKLWVELADGERIGPNEARGLLLARRERPSDDFGAIEPQQSGFRVALRHPPDQINPQDAFVWLQNLVNRASAITQERSQTLEEWREGGARLVQRMSLLGGE